MFSKTHYVVDKKLRKYYKNHINCFYKGTGSKRDGEDSTGFYYLFAKYKKNSE